VPPSRSLVTPVLAWWRDPSPVGVVDTTEVACVSRVPVSVLCDPVNRFSVRYPDGLLGPGFRVGEWFVWGATAVILDRVIALAGWERPWSRLRTELVPGCRADRLPRPPEAAPC
jgi:hypothetical protein